MRMTIDVDDELLARAEELTGISERSALIRDAVELLVRIETGRQSLRSVVAIRWRRLCPGVASTHESPRRHEYLDRLPAAN